MMYKNDFLHMPVVLGTGLSNTIILLRKYEKMMLKSVVFLRKNYYFNDT